MSTHRSLVEGWPRPMSLSESSPECLVMQVTSEQHTFITVSKSGWPKLVSSASTEQADYVNLPGMLSRSFPSTRVDDPVLTMAMPSGDAYPLGEERRLFYVALTRARRSVVLLTVKGEASSFLDELVEDRAVTVESTTGEVINEERCPACKIGVIVQRSGPHGRFEACSAYPRCEYRPRRRVSTQRKV
ncbi:topoisomerase DNA-binding C4 zinc finger domain-containing protein [Paraburkholderia sp. J11-2]|uniref:topoisomerase DNA-binding C4 zinc finger domain-containing protein n=1 Tax=Paraburkholderia sp. J11-2 TaxID=2805431 RepID=UPI002AB715F0|nr:topoisomerase DNA-binding C4 zinc finger domain-containing protein [Paraburkholderia sp. J11-2]